MFKQIKSALRAKRGSLQLESRGAHSVSLLIVVIVGLLGYLQVPYSGVLGFVMLGVIVYEFVKRMDQGLPLMQVTALLAVLQWIVGPWLTYNVDLFYSTYAMRGDSIAYFAYALPGTAAFIVSLLAVGVSPRQRGLMRTVDRANFVNLGMLLAILGFFGGLGATYLPGSLAFVFYLISQLRYVSALYFVFSRSPWRWLLAAMAVLPLFTGSAATGMFHDLMLWMGILACYWYALKRRKLRVTVLVLVFGCAAAFTIQGIKKGYREKVWNESKGSVFAEIQDFWTNPRAMFSEETITNAIVRINQGWIISAIMDTVPSVEPYAMGDTLRDAVITSLVPRLVVDDKTTAGGQMNYRRFTGLVIADSTSMGLSLLGEAYANVGPEGGILLMLAFGWMMSLPYAWCLHWSVKHPTFYFWIPVIFCQAIKAETDLVTTLNHITKGGLVAVALYWLFCVKLFPSAPLRISGRTVRARRVAKRGLAAMQALRVGANAADASAVSIPVPGMVTDEGGHPSLPY